MTSATASIISATCSRSRPCLWRNTWRRPKRPLSWRSRAPDVRATFISKGKGKSKKIERAEAAIRAFATRAYRRPAEPGEVARLTRFVELAEQNGQPFEKGIQLAFEAALVSPHFLFRVEMDRNNPKREPFAINPVSEYELASRLSYFLWSTMPDDELFKLADAKSLRTDLEAQVRRMLKGPQGESTDREFRRPMAPAAQPRGRPARPKNVPDFQRTLAAGDAAGD